MLRPYDIQVLPCTFFDDPIIQEPVTGSFFNRKRTITVEHRSASKILSVAGSTNFTHGTFPNNTQQKLKPKWIGESQAEAQDMITITRKAYESLIEQNRVKDQRIAELEQQLTLLMSKQQAEMHGNAPVQNGRTLSDLINLREVVDYNNMRSKRKTKK